MEHERSALTPEIVCFLASAQGKDLLHFAASLPNDRLTRLMHLRRHVASPIAAAIIELLESRQRARKRFSYAHSLFLTPDALEQASSESLAQWRAAHFPKNAPVLDACCSIGIDSLTLAQRGPVIATDYSLLRLTCALANAEFLASEFPISWLCQDVCTLDLTRLRRKGVYAAFCDPARRTITPNGIKRLHNLEELSPPLAWLEALIQHFPWGAIKLSPASNLSPLRRGPCVVEYVTTQGECSEATLWWGEALHRFAEQCPCATPYACATVLTVAGESHTLFPTSSQSSAQAVSLSPPQEWLYDPVPSVLRAGLVAELAFHLNGSLLDPHIAYITASVAAPTPFARRYRVLLSMPYNLKNIQTILRRQGWYVHEIKQRGLPFQIDSLLKALRSCTTPKELPITLVLARVADKPLALFTMPD